MSGKAIVLVVGLLAAAPSLAYAQIAECSDDDYGCQKFYRQSGLRPTAECSDGSTSYSAHFQGVCSHHGGVAVWYDLGMRDQANQWCDENPSLCEHSHWAGIEGHGYHPADEDNQ
jgi:hypothetical protein